METNSRKDVMQINKSQTGSAHVIIIVVLVVALVGALGFIFWSNFMREKPVSQTQNGNSQTDNQEDKKEIAKDPYDGWKTYTSITSSGLSFKYPADWDFTPATKEFVNNDGGKSNDITLTSKKPEVVPQGGAPKTVNQFMCVSFGEYTGAWQYARETFSNAINSESFSVADTSIFLNTYSDATLDRGNKPMGNIMRLIANPPSDKGQSYIDTRNNYHVRVIAQYNCLGGGEGIENLDADFEAQPDTMSAKLIMKSINF